MAISGRILVLAATVITAIAALFCIIGLATKGWTIPTTGSLFCDGCPKTPAALSVISFILLIVTVVAFALLVFDILQGPLRYIPFILLFVATIFLLSTFASYYAVGYSYNLMVVAHFFSYIALAIAAYWYGRTDAASGTG